MPLNVWEISVSQFHRHEGFARKWSFKKRGLLFVLGAQIFPVGNGYPVRNTSVRPAQMERNLPRGLISFWGNKKLFNLATAVISDNKEGSTNLSDSSPASFYSPGAR